MHGSRKWSKRLCEVIFSQWFFSINWKTGSIMWKCKFASGKFYATEHAVVVHHNDMEFNSRFLFYILDEMMNLNQYATGGAQPGLAVSKLNTLKVPIPKITEQERIVSILDKLMHW
jgi:restriction endonuclease S subunit